ncbi:MAG: adenylate/guanylate cyclase domain-containing protein [Gammaproteobacteria bacterium]|nr:adenylate/guanylate cyclase domain-containing protein [Gammaproteobacteria bacterium]
MSKAENLVVMFTDIVGFTEMTSMQSRGENEAMLNDNERLLMSVARQFGGERIKSIGDALLLVFKSPTDAVHCAMAMHDTLWEHNQNVSSRERHEIRVALNCGEVRIAGNDIFGEPVNVAARMEGITPANEVYFSEAIYLAMNKAEVHSEKVGVKELKGIPEPVTIYRVPRGSSAKRLVAVGEDEAKDNKYPYGGMHLLKAQPVAEVAASDDDSAEQPASNKRGVPIGKIAMGIAAMLLIAVGVQFIPTASEVKTSVDAVATPAPVKEFKSVDVRPELEALLEANNLIGLEARTTAILAELPNDPLAQFMQGHISAERRTYREALQQYGMALSQKPELAENERYANNLIKMMRGHGARVTELAKLSPTEIVVEKLAERAASPGINGRRDAAYILRELDRRDKLDSVAMAILDLKEGKDCKAKKAAIHTLKDRKDRRALPALREASSGTIFQNICTRKLAKKAIAAIDG